VSETPDMHKKKTHGESMTTSRQRVIDVRDWIFHVEIENDASCENVKALIETVRSCR
jgi:hypothetical protein